jgi:tetratricopeptide (TPR) repeat protein
MQSGDSQAFLAYARLCLRVGDAYWLYATQGEALAHAPDSDSMQHASSESMNALLERIHQDGALQSEIEILTLRSRAAQPQPVDETLAALDAQLSLGSDPEAVEGLAIAHLRAGRHDQALQVLRVHIGDGNGAGWAHILNGIALAKASKNDQSQKAFSLSSDDPSIRPLTMFLSSRILIEQGNHIDATAALNTATTAWPDEASWHYRLAQLYADQGDLDAALPHFQQAAELNPDEGDYALELARSLRELGQSTAAAAAFSKVIKTQPEDGPTWGEAGEAALESGNIKRAQEWFERACTISPSDAASLMGSARAYQALGNLREAEDRAQAALRISPQDPNVLMGLGEILASRGQYEKAIRTYDQALSSATDPIAVHLRRSDLMVKLGRAPQAVEHLIEIVRHEPNDDRIWGTLTHALEVAEDLESAMEAATRAVRLAPRNAAYRLALGRISRKSGHLDRAIEELTQAEAIAPSEAEIATELGNAYLDRRELPRAVEAYQRAISRDANYAPAHFGKAMAHKGLKNYQDASDELGKALDLNPNDPEAHQQLAAVRALTLVHGGALQPVE